MFHSNNASKNFAKTQDLYCVWIRVNETPGAPLVAVWVDSKMRAFATAEDESKLAAKDCRAAEKAETFDTK